MHTPVFEKAGMDEDGVLLDSYIMFCNGLVPEAEGVELVRHGAAGDMGRFETIASSVLLNSRQGEHLNKMNNYIKL